MQNLTYYWKSLFVEHDHSKRLKKKQKQYNDTKTQDGKLFYSSFKQKQKWTLR